jgi:tetratricopeptide (TPR) repeat protein/DNA-binding CsgD family transcriptional regulator
MFERAILPILLFSLYPQLSLAQQAVPGIPAPSDTTLINTLIDSSYTLSFSNPDRAIKFANQALELSRELNYKQGMAGAHGELGYAYSVKGEFQQAVSHLDHGIALSRAMGDSIGLVSQLNDLGSVYKTQSEYDQALRYYFKALGICERIGLQRGISATLGNIGLSYFEMEEHKKALKYYKQALEINRRLENRSSMAINYNNIGLLHGDMGRYEEALTNHFKALDIRRELEYTLEVANSLNNIGRLYMQQGQSSKALDYLQQALDKNNNRDVELTSIIHENLTKVYLADEKYDTAVKHAQKSLDLSKEIDSKLGEKVAYELLAKTYQQKGDYRSALEYQKKLMAVKDSIFNTKKAKQIDELQTKYETAKKEKEIAILEKQKQQETLLRNAFMGGLILIGIIGLLIYNRQRLKIKKNRTELENKKLKEQKLEQQLEFKNKKLTNHTLHLVQKNEVMKELKEKINKLRQRDEKNINQGLQKVQNLVDYSFNLDEDWEQFKIYFEEVHSGFFDELKEQYPDLTPNELRLAALAKLHLSIKEIATIMGITPNSVKTARYRLRKKLGMKTEENLTEFMMQIGKKGKN